MNFIRKSIEKPGRGVPEGPQKHNAGLFFEIFFRKFWHFCKANLLYILMLLPTTLLVFFASMFTINVLLPTVTESGAGEAVLLLSLCICNLFTALWGMGPATAGMMYLMRNFSREQHAWIWSDYVASVKENWKQALAIFLIDILVIVLVGAAAFSYNVIGGSIAILRYVLYAVVIFYTMMHFYLYPMMVSYRLPLKGLFRNSVLFVMAKLPQTFGLLLLQLFIFLGLPLLAMRFGGNAYSIWLLILILLDVAFMQAFSAYLTCYIVCPIMKKHMPTLPEEAEEQPAISEKA